MKSDETYLKAVGLNIRRIRKQKGLTMVAVAFDADMEYRQLGRIERGEINTSILAMLKISKALKVEVFVFFQFDK